MRRLGIVGLVIVFLATAYACAGQPQLSKEEAQTLVENYVSSKTDIPIETDLPYRSAYFKTWEVWVRDDVGVSMGSWSVDERTKTVTPDDSRAEVVEAGRVKRPALPPKLRMSSWKLETGYLPLSSFTTRELLTMLAEQYVAKMSRREAEELQILEAWVDLQLRIPIRWHITYGDDRWYLEGPLIRVTLLSSGAIWADYYERRL